MKFKVYWKEIQFLEVEKINDTYYSKLFSENVEKVVEDGYPKTFIMNIKAMDDKLPKIIRNRLPSVDYMSEKIENTDDLEKSIVEYINKTKCRRVTDNISIEIEE